MRAAPFEPWVSEVNGSKRLPAFSSRARLNVFTRSMATRINKVFPLVWTEMSFEEIRRDVSAEVVDLNLYSPRSWELRIQE
jgi:hypothetical protein